MIGLASIMLKDLTNILSVVVCFASPTQACHRQLEPASMPACCCHGGCL